MKSRVNPGLAVIWAEALPALEKECKVFEQAHGISSPTLADQELALFNLNPCLYVGYVDGPTPAQEHNAAQTLMVGHIREHIEQWGKSVSFAAIGRSFNVRMVPKS